MRTRLETAQLPHWLKKKKFPRSCYVPDQDQDQDQEKMALTLLPALKWPLHGTQTRVKESYGVLHVLAYDDYDDDDVDDAGRPSQSR